MPNETVPRGHCNRCDRCGWTLSDPAYGGCAPGNCSMRTGPDYKTVPPRDTCAGCGRLYEDAPATPPSDVGIYRKFVVERADGSSRPGGKHERVALDDVADPFDAWSRRVGGTE